MKSDDTTDAVREKYSRVATNPNESFGFPVGLAFAESVGYPREQLEQLPQSITESFTGAHNPLLVANLKAGEVVLDLGCGAGLDMYFAALSVGPEGFVHGLDFSADMIGKAKDNLASLGIRNVDFHIAAGDDIPLPDNSVDIVISNGIYNLSPQKEPIVAEVFRVLRPHGRTVLSEIILKKRPKKKDVCDLKDWFK
jgi:ubiquinone/menaquinone biosynthesis C-methylase UbiE